MDPCLDCDSPGTVKISPAAAGTWHFQTLTATDPDLSDYVCNLMIIHESLDQNEKLDFEYIGDIGVVAAQAGFVDPETWSDENDVLLFDDDNLRDMIFASSKGAAAMDNGCGCMIFGDGEYPVMVARNAEGVVVAASIGILECGTDDEECESDESEQSPLEQTVWRLISRSLSR